MPADSGAAFVVVSHQAPTGQSLLPEILAKSTTMPVQEIANETRALANQVYVVPRGQVVEVQDGVLMLQPIAESRSIHNPIDAFFGSLARDRGQGAVGIVLSGTGADGTLGLTAIKDESGLCLVQSPATAEFNGMPESAIAAGLADFSLPVLEMPERIAEHVRSLDARDLVGRSAKVSPDEIAQIVGYIRIRGGRDFSDYRIDTLLRRIERRMDLHRIENGKDYVRFLEKNREEAEALWRDWLIGVTSFFRDPEAFAALAQSGLSSLLASHEGDTPLRLWVTACASGEEAYSIAIELIEVLEARGSRLDFQIFATDLDPAAIDVARAGRYPKEIRDAVGPRRLERFFSEQTRDYRVKSELRDRIVFAVQDVLHDPPFTRVDLISCRNLLIYIVPRAQQDLLSVFHYALNPGGLLFLGASEHLGQSAELFASLASRWRLFVRGDSVAAKPLIRLKRRNALAKVPGVELPVPATHNVDLTETMRAALADRFGPPAVIVDLQGQIRESHGRLAPYLALRPGRAKLNVLDMAREGLRAPLAEALHALATKSTTTIHQDIRAKFDDGWQVVRLSVGTIGGQAAASPLVLISFEARSDRGADGPKRKSSRPPARSRNRAQLEDELDQMRQDLQAGVSNLESANEELASANEETQSANEELQSTNEELQTAKEETQSLNEELQTLNAELTEKLIGAEQTNNDLVNLMSNIEIATIFLDDQLRVTRFTPQAHSVAKLIDGDIGRPLADLATLVDYPDLLLDAGNVLASLRPVERQASAPGGVWFNVRIRPYRTPRNAVDGLVVTFIEITQTKRAERVQAARELAEGIVDAVHEPLLVLDPSLRVVRANRSFYEAFHVAPDETEWHRVEELGTQQWSSKPLQQLMETTLREGASFENVEIVHEFPSIGKRRMLLSGRPVTISGDEKPSLIVLGIQDAGPAEAKVEDKETAS